MIQAWHFLPDAGLTRFEPRVKVEVGQTLKETRPLLMCNVGLHASVLAIDALQYAPGARLCRVELGGEILTDTDKLCASERTCIAMIDATAMLHEFACNVAEASLLLSEVIDQRSWDAIEAKRAWLRHEIDDDQLDAAWAAARAAAARDAARDAAAWAAAWAAARAAARAAAWDAARAAARAAASAAAWDAARDAASAEQNIVLEQMIAEEMEVA